MIETWEIRYFGKGDMPPESRKWQQQLNMSPQEGRTDVYFLGNITDKTGIKLREGRLEIKEQLGTTDNLQIAHYVKWGFKLEENSIETDLSRHDSWQEVTKKRLMAKYQVEDGGIRNIPMDEEVKDYCEIELSSIICGHDLWWTVAFEAGGSIDNLRLTYQKFRNTWWEGAERIGYAGWLLKYIKR